jgi:DNA-entry nuclease
MMPNRRTKSKNSRPVPRRKAGSKTTSIKKRTSRPVGRNKRNRNNRRSNFNFGKFSLLMVITFFVVTLARNDFDVQETISDFRSIYDLFTGDHRPDITFSDDFYAQAESLAMLYPEGREVVYLDVMTIQAEDWEYERLDIGGHDHLDRTLPIIAYLSERNLGTAEERSSQSHNPTGWQQNQLEIDGSDVWIKNRGHLIAYTFTFNFNEDGAFVDGYLGSEDHPANLFTQTAHSNQNVMTRYEEQIRAVLLDGGKVVYQAAPIFRDDELMARGIWLQAISTCGELMFSVYIFNEQPGVIIDHETGENWLYQ